MICAVTGHVEEEYIKECMDSGMDRIFSKPVSVADIKELFEGDDMRELFEEAE
jgi:CheY-like chemotaxis protein